MNAPSEARRTVQGLSRKTYVVLVKATPKLDDAKIAEIRRARALPTPESMASLAARLGVSLATVHKYGRKPDIVATDDMVDRPVEHPAASAPAAPEPRALKPSGTSHQDVTRAILEAQQAALLESVQRGEVLSLLDQKRAVEISAKLERMGGKEPEADDAGYDYSRLTPEELREWLRLLGKLEGSC